MSDYDHVEALRNAANEMRREGQKGWPNVCASAADEIEQLRTELDKVTRWCAGLLWAADQVDEPTIGEIRAYVDRCVTKGNSDE